MQDNSLTVNNLPTIHISKEVEARLKAKITERNDELLIDYLEQIEIHKAEIQKLTEKVNRLSNGLFATDADDL